MHDLEAAKYLNSSDAGLKSILVFNAHSEGVGGRL